MNKKLLLVAVFLALPIATFAAAYQYVDVSGQVRDVTAASADQAFALAVNIAPNSGVALDTGTVSQGQQVGSVMGATAVTVTQSNLYQYVSVSGQVKTVAALTPAQALALATDIAPHSGVMSVIAGEGPLSPVVSVAVY